MPHLLALRGGKQREILVEVAAQAAIENAHAGRPGEFEGANRARIAHYGEKSALDGVASGRLLGPLLVAHDATGNRGRAGPADFDARAAQGSIEVFGRGLVVEPQRDVLELLFERRGGVVADAGDAASAEVERGEGLERVVELRGGEVNGDGLIAGDAARVLEVADAILVENDAADGQLAVFARGWRGRRSLFMGFGCGLGNEEGR